MMNRMDRIGITLDGVTLILIQPVSADVYFAILLGGHKVVLLPGHTVSGLCGYQVIGLAGYARVF